MENDYRRRQTIGSGNKKTNQSASIASEKNILNSKIAKSESRRLRKSRNQPKGLILIGLLIFVFLVLLLVLIYKMPDNPEVLEEDNLLIETAELTNLMTFSASEAKRYYPFSDQLIYFTQEKIEIQNYGGEILYDEFLDFERPVAVYNDNYFLAGDRASNKILILNHQTKQFSLQLDGVFAGAYFGGDDYLAVIEENFEQPGFVHIVDLGSGDKILTIQFLESGYPLAVAFSNSLDYFDVLLINTKGSTLQPVIKRYDLEGKQIAQTMLNDYPFLYGKIFHDNNDNIIVASPTNILVLNMEKEQPILEYNAGKIYDIFSAANITAFASNRAEGDMFVLDWNSEQLSFTENKVTLLNQIQQHAYKNSFIAISNNNQVQVYDQNSGELVLDQILDSNIIRLGITGNTLILIMEQGVKTLNF